MNFNAFIFDPTLGNPFEQHSHPEQEGLVLNPHLDGELLLLLVYLLCLPLTFIPLQEMCLCL